LSARVASALRPFITRALVARGVRALVVGFVFAVLAGEAALVARFFPAMIFFSSLAVATVSAVIYAVRKRPAPVSVARRIDERARLDDLIVTAVGCGDEDGGTAPVICRSALDVLRHVEPRKIYPIEAPRHWRRGIAAIALVQAVLLAFAWRMPSARPQQSGLTSMTLPAGSAGPQSQSGQNPPPPRASATPAPSTSDSRTGVIAANSSPAQAQPDGSVKGDSASSNEPGTLRLASANGAVTDVPGRVPLAMRGVVARYFKSIQSRGKRHP
jgi:hypothetical protein